MAKDHVPSMIRIRDDLFAARLRSGTFTCFVCHNQALDVSLDVFEGRGSLLFECRSCGFVDHMSRLPLPEWVLSDH